MTKQNTYSHFKSSFNRMVTSQVCTCYVTGIQYKAHFVSGKLHTSYIVCTPCIPCNLNLVYMYANHARIYLTQILRTLNKF